MLCMMWLVCVCGSRCGHCVGSMCAAVVGAVAVGVVGGGEGVAGGVFSWL